MLEMMLPLLMGGWEAVVLFTNVWMLGAGGDTVLGRSMESVGQETGCDAMGHTAWGEEETSTHVTQHSVCTFSKSWFVAGWAGAALFA